MCSHEGERDKKFNSTLFKTNGKTIKKYGQFTDIDWRKCAQDASAKNPVLGIKGKCQLMKLDYLDMGSIAPPECLHAVYLGMIQLINGYFVSIFYSVIIL